jgi:hypothetical protein
MPPYDSITYMVGRLSFGKISIGIFIALSTANIKRLIVITTIVIGLFSADVTIDIVDYFNRFKTVFKYLASPKSSPKERTLTIVDFFLSPSPLERGWGEALLSPLSF